MDNNTLAMKIIELAGFASGIATGAAAVFAFMKALSSESEKIHKQMLAMKDQAIADINERYNDEKENNRQHSTEKEHLKKANDLLMRKTSCLMCPTCGGSVRHVDTKKYDSQDYHYASTYIFKCETCDTPILIDANQFSELFREISKNIKHI